MPVLKIKKTDGTWQEVWGVADKDTNANAPRLVTVTIPVSGWGGSNNLYSQVLNISGVNANSKLDLQPTPTQVLELQESEIALMVTNNAGVATIYSLYGKPSSDMRMQILITDVEVIS